MAVTVNVTGNGNFQGANSNLEDYSVTEESTPIDPSDSSGATGSISFTVIEDEAADGTILLLSDIVELEDGSNGRTRGTVSSVVGRNGEATVTADSRLNLLVVNKQTQPFNGTLGAALLYYFSLGGITTEIIIDPAIAARTVAYPGFNGDLWTYLKQICAQQQIEISLVSANVVVRPIRTRIAEVQKDINHEWTATNVDIAQAIEINYYNNEYKTNTLVYPKTGWNEDVPVYQVDGGQLVEVDIPVDVSLTNITQPVCVTTVSREYDLASVYCVTDQNNRLVSPTRWARGGGKIIASINPDRKSIHLAIYGAKDPGIAPYRIGVSVGPSDYYSSLRILGSGVFFDPQTLTIPTGAPASATSVDVGITVDNPFISTPTEALNLGIRTAQRYAGADQNITMEATVINRRGDRGVPNSITFGEFDALYPTDTFGTFDTTWAGKKYSEFNKAMVDLNDASFENQAFGNVAGARVKFREAWYRIRAATIGPDTITYTAERDTTFGDFSTAWAGKTFAQFNARFAGMRYSDFGVIPLWQ